MPAHSKDGKTEFIAPSDFIERIRNYRPQRILKGVEGHAAIALVLLRGFAQDFEVLLIERAIRDGDPWSGQIALPGGHVEKQDLHLEQTAIRESFEEVGIRLPDALGSLDDLRVHTGPRRVVTPFVFLIEELPDLVLDKTEVAKARWEPLSHLVDPQRRTQQAFHRDEQILHFPAITIDNNKLWGLTYRAIANLLRLANYDLPLPK